MSDQAPPSSLGEFLRQEREKRGITIEQVASATKINIRLLHLLEADQYSELPAKPFIRGFVSSYARFIGIESKELLIHFGEFLEMRSQDRPKRDAGHSGYAFEKREGEQSRTILWIVMGAFLVFGGIGFIFLKPSLKRHKSSHLERLREANPGPTESSPVLLGTLPSGSPSPSESAFALPSPSSAPVAAVEASPTQTPVAARIPKPSPSPSPSPSRSPSPKATASPIPSASASTATGTEDGPDPLNSGKNVKPNETKYKVVFKAGQDLWVRYQIDSRPKMKFILREGRVLVLKARESIRFQTSDPGSITFRVNGAQSRVMEGDKNAAVKGGDLTLFFPKELMDTTQEVFAGDKTLQGAKVPASKAASPTPEPSP